MSNNLTAELTKLIKNFSGAEGELDKISLILELDSSLQKL